MMSKSGEMSDEVTKKSDNFSSYKLLEVTLHSYTFTFRRLNEKYEYNIYRVSHNIEPTLFFAILSASTIPKYKILVSVKKFRKFAIR